MTERKITLVVAGNDVVKRRRRTSRLLAKEVLMDIAVATGVVAVVEALEDLVVEEAITGATAIIIVDVGGFGAVVELHSPPVCLHSIK